MSPPLPPGPPSRRPNGIVTITTGAAHGFVAGQTVMIQGITPGAYDGVYTILSVPTPTSFTYALPLPYTGLAPSTAAGTAFPAATAALAIQNALALLPNIGANNVSVTAQPGPGFVFSVALAPSVFYPMPTFSIAPANLTGSATGTFLTGLVVSNTITGVASSTPSTISGGVLTLAANTTINTADSGTTPGLAISAVIANTAGSFTLTKGGDGTLLLNAPFANSYSGNQTVTTLVNTGTLLLGDTGGPAINGSSSLIVGDGLGGQGANKVDVVRVLNQPQTITVANGTTGGTFTLSFNNQTTSAINFGADVIPATTGASESGTTVTITTSTPNGFVVGQTVTIAGLTPAGYNGTYTIASVSSSTSFTYFNATTGLTPTTTAGTVILNAGTAFIPATTGATESGNVVSITTAAPHGFIVGQSVTIAGLTPAGYNGTFTVASVPTTTTFTYVDTNSGLTATTTTGTAVLATGVVPIPSAFPATETGNVVTITTLAPHGFVVGQNVTIAGLTPAGYNGTFTITSVPTTTTFTYVDTVTGLAPATSSGTATLAPSTFATTAAGIQAALAALTSVGAGNVTVTAGPSGSFTVVFANTITLPGSALAVVNNSLTPTGSTITAAFVNEIAANIPVTILNSGLLDLNGFTNTIGKPANPTP